MLLNVIIHKRVTNANTFSEILDENNGQTEA